MYEADFQFVVNGVTILVDQATDAAALTGSVTTTALAAMPSVYYVDTRNAEMAEGIESKFIYNDVNDGASSVAGVDKD